MDVTSLSDPIVVVSLKTPGSTWTEIARTEHIKFAPFLLCFIWSLFSTLNCLRPTHRNNLNPKFVTPIKMDYRFETTQNLLFSVYDVDHVGKSLDAQDFLGCAETTLGAIICDKGGCFKAELKNPKYHHTTGTIIVAAEEVRGGADDVMIQFSAKGLAKKDLFGKSDGYVVISQQRDPSQPPVSVAKTEVFKNSLNPTWKPITASVQTICNGDFNRPLLLEVWDWDKSSSHDLIGSAHTTLKELLSESPRPSFVLIDEKKKAKGKKGEAGVLFVDNAQTRKNPTFVEYLKGGLEIGLIVAVDFTGSNGQPSMSTSNHYAAPWNGVMHSLYSKAIAAVGSVLLQYDRDGMVPIYGFGAKMPPAYQVSHCFPLNGNPSNPEVAGIPGMLDAYFKTLSQVQLYGPTLFTPVLQTASQIADMNSRNPAQQKYYILVVCTDGCVDDMQATTDNIVRAANGLPLSVVIVGVGNADFTKMNFLDSDQGALRASDGTLAMRDIVQFVPFNQFESAPWKLAEETLAEVPQQVVSYFKARNILPLPPAVIAPPPPPPLATTAAAVASFAPPVAPH